MTKNGLPPVFACTSSENGEALRLAAKRIGTQLRDVFWVERRKFDLAALRSARVLMAASFRISGCEASTSLSR